VTVALACPACGATGTFRAGVCGRCGYAEGEAQRCPHCEAIARPVLGGTNAWVCAMCGGPRIPGGVGGEPAANALRQAKVLLGGRARARARAIAWTVLAVMATLFVVAVAAKAALATSVVLFVLAALPAFLALRARSQGSARGKAAEDALARAWQAAAEAIAAKAPAGLTVEALAEALSIDEARADRLLTNLAVHDRVRIDVGDDAVVRYSVAPEDGAAMDELLEEHGEPGRTAGR